MDELETNYSLDIMEQLMHFPCSKPFINPVNDKEEGFENYYKKIKDPIDLGQIQAKLLTNEYKSFEDVRHDINAIVKNTERFFGKTSCQAALSREMQMHFNKLIADDEEKDIRGWFDDVKEIEQKLERIFQGAPNKVKSHCKSILTIPPLPVLSDNEIRTLIKAAQELKDKKDVQKMLKIILEKNPDMEITSKDLVIEVDELDNVTLWLLKDYVERRYQELGRRMPQ